MTRNATDKSVHNARLYCVVFALSGCMHVGGLYGQELVSPQQEQQLLWQHCPPDFVPPALNYQPRSRPVDQLQEEQETVIVADKAVATNMEIFELTGDVRITRGSVVINANDVEYRRSSDVLIAEGALRLEADNVLVLGDKAQMNLSTAGIGPEGSHLDTARIDNAQIWLPQNHLRGEATQIALSRGQQISLSDATLTACMPGHNDWSIKASELRLDKEKNLAVARHARLRLFDVPVLYTPYLSFPITGRKTGLLVPSLGTSNTSGLEIGLPFYWNIAPNRDATITPRYFSKRGLQLQTEFRYLNPTNSGQVYAEYLHDDALYEQERSFLYLQHSAKPAEGWSADLQYRRASDNDYLTDFGGDLALSNLDFLERQFNVSYQAPNWSAGAQALDYQTLDKTIAPQSQPYSLLPKVRFDTAQLPLAQLQDNSLQFKLNSEMVNFQREDSLTGRRLDLYPQVQLPVHKVHGFLVPRLAMHYTRYQLANNFDDTEDNPTRTVPIASLDSGLFFERDLRWGSAVLQTLEPRLFYLYAPYVDQSRLLVDTNGRELTFDSAATQLSLAQMFRDNRYSGLDRIGDANRLSASLTSRFYNPQGKELFSASVGQIYYFSDRRVTLPGEAVQTSSKSDLLLEMRSQWAAHTYGTVNFLWDEQHSRTGRGTFNFRYQPHRDKMLNLGYRYEHESIDQSDVTLIWPLRHNLKFMGRWLYSILDDMTLENIEGLQYDTCCWALRLVHRRYVGEIDEGQYQQNFLLQVELKGLANVGNDISRLFTEGRLE